MKENKNELQIAAFLLNLFLFFFLQLLVCAIVVPNKHLLLSQLRTEFVDLHYKMHAPRYFINETTRK